MKEESMKFTGEFMVPGQSGEWTEKIHLARYKFASGFVGGKDVLDIACGVGYGSALLAESGAHSVEGVDIRDENVHYAKTSYCAKNLFFSQGDITSHGQPESYDLIVCFETIEHIDCYNSALLNCHRLLRPGGTLLISSPNRPLSSPGRWILDPPENRFHVREFTVAELYLLLEAAGFSVSRNDVFGQGFQWVSKSLIITKVLRKCFIRPFGSTDVTRCQHSVLSPNYFIVSATKP
jgi:SAM-dependent methyltransferase